MRHLIYCLLVLVYALCLQPLVAAGKAESTDTVHTSIKDKKNNSIPSSQGGSEAQGADTLSPAVGENTAATTQTEDVSAEAATNAETTVSTVEANESAAVNSESASLTGLNGSKVENGEPADVTFASIHSKGLAVADGNKWYYENFDRHGRSSFAVLYEDGTAVEKTVWTYKDADRYPVQKKILRTAESEIFRYDEEGRELSIERYEGKMLVSKTENIYNGAGQLIEQAITLGENADRSVWEFAGDKAVTQTKYRNGKKTAFIELHSTPHIVHLYVDDKEVYVGEEQ